MSWIRSIVILASPIVVGAIAVTFLSFITAEVRSVTLQLEIQTEVLQKILESLKSRR